jgi:hypothetical protein
MDTRHAEVLRENGTWIQQLQSFSPQNTRVPFCEEKFLSKFNKNIITFMTTSRTNLCLQFKFVAQLFWGFRLIFSVVLADRRKKWAGKRMLWAVERLWLFGGKEIAAWRPSLHRPPYQKHRLQVFDRYLSLGLFYFSTSFSWDFGVGELGQKLTSSSFTLLKLIWNLSTSVSQT